MKGTASWQGVRDEVRRRIHAREWAPGDPVPNESDLAASFGCARTTVNRALRSLADDGLLDRRRKAGTRVALHPVRKATFAIPIVRREIEDLGRRAGYRLLSLRAERPPASLAAEMRTDGGARMVHVTSLHTADERPFMFEDRWIDPRIVPEITDANLEETSANEWLLVHAPYTRGDISFRAETVGRRRAAILDCAATDATFVVHRCTWDGNRAVTSVRQSFSPDYTMSTTI